MDDFNIANCDSDYAIKVKNEYKRGRNNQHSQNAFFTLLNDTRVAIKNIEIVLGNESELQELFSGIQQCNTSVFDNILGTVSRGNNDSHYRSYLALDEQSVIEIRISTHYETVNALRGNTNNKSQYLYQVVLRSTPPQQQDGVPIINTARVGNTKVLTKGIIGIDSSIEEIKQLLMSIHDYLYFPNYSYDTEVENTNKTNENMNKSKIRLTELQLHNVIRESVKRVLNEWEDPNDGVDVPTKFNDLYNIKQYIDNAINALEHGYKESYNRSVEIIRNKANNIPML